MQHHTAAASLASRGHDLSALLTARNVRSVEKVSNPHLDAFIKPLGLTYEDGFVLAVNAGKPETRIRFSVAHELCHTFFYELVPELKFGAHPADALEERLCNFGAGELVVPAPELVEAAAALTPGFDSLDELCGRFGISAEVIIIRLRELAIWPCELSVWNWSDDGFALDRCIGLKKYPWRWADTDALWKIWRKGDGARGSGRTAVYFENGTRESFAKYIYYVARRQGNSIAALWSHSPFDCGPPPLLRAGLRRADRRLLKANHTPKAVSGLA